MSVKAYALLTGHHLDASGLPQPLAEMMPASIRPNDRGQFENRVFPREAREWAFQTFQEALQPLKHTGKLGLRALPVSPVGQVQPRDVRLPREPLGALDRQ